ncbi:MAG: NAD(P)H-dependent glycerol-3-phosphate dehydrogenase [Stappiaceae bacterium]
MSSFEKVGVMGGGAWGTALALAAARADRQVTLWARNDETVRAINSSRQNPDYLPGITFDAPINATGDLADLSGQDAMLLVTPAQTTRAMASQLASLYSGAIPVLLCAKGIERHSGQLLSEVFTAEMPNAIPAVLSGPSFADDVAAGLPTAVTIAAPDLDVADALSRMLASNTLRPYASDDITGAQIGGSLKNVLAIACGAVVGKGLGASAVAALTARGFAELTRLGTALGARAETLTGLSGLGDLVLTCSSKQSRNFSFGIKLGQGMSIEELSQPGQKLAEGAHTAEVAVDLAGKHDVELPICEAVANTVSGKTSVDQAIATLLRRPLRHE